MEMLVRGLDVLPAADRQSSDPVVGRVRVLGQDVYAVAHVDRDEDHRRHAAERSALTRLDAISALTELPRDTAVHLTSLPAYAQRLLLAMPTWAVEIRGPFVRRLVDPPLTAVSVVLAARTWTTGLRRARRFAMYCPATVIVSTPPPSVRDAAIEANYHGCGLAFRAGSVVEPIVMPEVPGDVPLTPAGWLFDEQIWGQLPALRCRPVGGQ